MYECSRLTSIMSRLFILLYFVTLVPGEGNQAVWEHHCDPGSELFACSVASFIYNPGENHSRLIVPDGVRKVRLLFPWDKVLVRDKILAYDRVLHAELNHPRAVRIRISLISVLEIPMDLEYADFNGNYIKKLIAPEPHEVEAEYSLRYLDLANSINLNNIDNISVLVNLETLSLHSNLLETLDEKIFRRMTKLSTLWLARNNFIQLQLSLFPLSLVNLDLTGNNRMTNLDLSKAHLPKLEKLSLTANRFSSLNVSELRLALPSLKELHIARNNFNYSVENALVAALQDAGIAYDDFEKGPPNTDQYRNDLRRQLEIESHILRDVVFTLVIAAVNLSLVIWVGHRIWRARKVAADSTVRQ